MIITNCPKCGSMNITTAGVCANCGWSQFAQVTKVSTPIEDALRKRIAELEKALNIDTDLTIAGLRKELRDATTRIAELGSELGRKSVELGELVGENILWKVINDELKSRIAELEAERRWIPVSERMPDDWESVLTIDISKSTQDVVSAFYNPETSLWSTPFSSDLWVTHWMPLPEPPIVYGKVCE